MKEYLPLAVEYCDDVLCHLRNIHGDLVNVPDVAVVGGNDDETH